MSPDLRGLVIRQPFVDWILDGKKTWEIRGSATEIRGRIALIAAGTGTIVGTCDLIDVRGPLTLAELKANAKRLKKKASEMTGPLYYGDHTYAWILSSARRLPDPIAYRHPSGAVIWVRLSPDVAAKIPGEQQMISVDIVNARARRARSVIEDLEDPADRIEPRLETRHAFTRTVPW